jgi:peptidoglycan/LPS O-acetylase OafA/YrhL
MYFPGLDGLRFLAFLLVFIHNAPAVLPGQAFAILHNYGWIGVDLFLSLSAFLLTRLLINEYEQKGSFSIPWFYIRRTLRIWPLYFLVVLLSTAVTIHLSGWTPSAVLRFAGLMTFTENILAVWFSFNTFAFIPQLWTISYEEQFYAILPWALRWLLKKSEAGKWTFAAVFFLVCVSLRALFVYWDVPYPAIYVLPFTHFVAILGGFMLGLGLLDRLFEKVPRWLLVLTAFAYLGLVVTLPNKEVIGWHLILTYPGLSTTLLVYAILHDPQNFFSRLLAHGVMSHPGKISYGLYMYHFFGLNVAHYLANRLGISQGEVIRYPVFILAAGFVVTFSFAELSYRYFEKPFLKLKERFTFIASRPV